ncbi:MAG TPA: LanC-like protein [Rhizomicrobium sp.]
MYDAARHSPVAEQPWNAGEARAAIDEIAADAVTAFDPDKFWRAHPQDEGAKGAACLYFGAAGVVWALDYLRRAGIAAAEFDFHPALAAIVARSTDWIANGPAAPYAGYGSLLLGDLGALLLSMRLEPERQTADRIFERAKGNDAMPLAELMWGTPGSMIACVHMRAMTGEERFAQLFRSQAKRLLDDLQDDAEGLLWTHEIYNQRVRYLGAVHGFAGNIAALLAGWDMLDDAQQARVQAATVRTLEVQANLCDAGTDWPERASSKPPLLLCQHCHGAPGMITSLAAAPFSTPQFEALLLGGGTLTWNAGPLAKGSNLCHGTGGNGYALLKLYRRTGDAVWLERARRFAMTAIGQVRDARTAYGQGRYALWTGDAGLAVYLLDCIRAEAKFPTIDVF